MSETKSIFLKDPRVLDAMLPYLTSFYGNPHSRTHAYGWESEKAMEKAREQIANLVGADAKEIIFTSGATESNNISIKGVARYVNISIFLSRPTLILNCAQILRL